MTNLNDNLTSLYYRLDNRFEWGRGCHLLNLALVAKCPSEDREEDIEKGETGEHDAHGEYCDAIAVRVVALEHIDF